MTRAVAARAVRAPPVTQTTMAATTAPAPTALTAVPAPERLSRAPPRCPPSSFLPALRTAPDLRATVHSVPANLLSTPATVQIGVVRSSACAGAGVTAVIQPPVMARAVSYTHLTLPTKRIV